MSDSQVFPSQSIRGDKNAAESLHGVDEERRTFRMQKCFFTARRQSRAPDGGFELINSWGGKKRADWKRRWVHQHGTDRQEKTETLLEKVAQIRCRSFYSETLQSRLTKNATCYTLKQTSSSLLGQQRPARPTRWLPKTAASQRCYRNVTHAPVDERVESRHPSPGPSC